MEQFILRGKFVNLVMKDNDYSSLLLVKDTVVKRTRSIYDKIHW